jgi:hypothetical protein
MQNFQSKIIGTQISFTTKIDSFFHENILASMN